METREKGPRSREKCVKVHEPDEVETVKNLLKEEMEKAVTLSVPMEVDCHTGSDWYDAK